MVELLLAMGVPTAGFGLFALLAYWAGAESRPWFDERPVLDDRPNWFPITRRIEDPDAEARRGRRAARGHARARPASAPGGGRHEGGDEAVGRVISASRSGSEPSARSAALVIGPIEASRGPSSVPAASCRKRADDALVNVAQSAPSTAARASSSSGSATVRYSARTSTSAPRSRSASGRTSRASSRARDQRAPVAAVGERLGERLADGAVGHDVGLDAVRAQRLRRARPDRGDRGAGERAGVAHRLEQALDAVGAR